MIAMAESGSKDASHLETETLNLNSMGNYTEWILLEVRRPFIDAILNTERRFRTVLLSSAVRFHH
jgi:hypothetical protein